MGNALQQVPTEDFLLNAPNALRQGFGDVPLRMGGEEATDLAMQFGPGGLGMLRPNAAAGVTKAMQKIVDEGDIPLFHGTQPGAMKQILSSGNITAFSGEGASLTRSAGVARDIGGPVVFVMKRREVGRVKGGVRPLQEVDFHTVGGKKVIGQNVIREAEERSGSIPTSLIKEVLIDPSPFLANSGKGTKTSLGGLNEKGLRQIMGRLREAKIPFSFIKGVSKAKRDRFSAPIVDRFSDLRGETQLNILREFQ